MLWLSKVDTANPWPRREGAEGRAAIFLFSLPPISSWHLPLAKAKKKSSGYRML
jgi:hypothetical protein